MKWFDEQLRTRQENDQQEVDKIFEEIEDRLIHPQKTAKVEKNKKTKMKTSFLKAIKFTFGFMKPADHVVIILFSIVVAGLGLLTPYLTNILINNADTQKDIDILKVYGIALAATSIGLLLISIVRALISNFIAFKVSGNAEAAFFKKSLHFPNAFYRDHSSSEIAMYISYANSICTISISYVYNQIVSILFSLVYIVQIFVYAKSLVILALAVPLVYIIVSSLLYQVNSNFINSYISANLEEEAFTGVLMGAIQKIRITGSEKRGFTEWGKRYKELIGIKYNPPLIIKLSSSILNLIILGGNLIIFIVAYNSGVTPNALYTFTISYSMVSSAFIAGASMLNQAAVLKPLLDKADIIINTKEEQTEIKEKVNELSGSLSVKDLCFGYPGGESLINHLSFDVEPGQYIGITGPSGCGKSTIIKLLLGFEKPNWGGIYYDDKNLNDLDLQSLRKKMGIVLQDSKLFMGSIKDNISISNPDMPEEDLWNAAISANIANDIKEMPMGIESYITEGAGGISGGQRQRIMIARAIAGHPNILFFDEATSALDNISQRKVIDALDNMKCTRIVIAHRLSTIKQCDRILYIEHGTVVEDGNFEELMALNGKFASMVQRQLY